MRKQLSVKSAGGRGGERRRRSLQASLAVLGRLRRLEAMVVSLLSPAQVRWVTDAQLKSMIQSILDGWGGNPREAVQVLDQGSDVGQGKRNAGIDRRPESRRERSQPPLEALESDPDES